MTGELPGTGTMVPAQLRDLVTPLEAEAMRETARTLLRLADRLDGKTSRVAFVPPQSGQCGICGQDVTGDACPDCAPRRA